MLYGIAVVLGFVVVIGIAFAVISYYLRQGLHSHDSEIIDPPPETNATTDPEKNHDHKH